MNGAVTMRINYGALVALFAATMNFAAKELPAQVRDPAKLVQLPAERVLGHYTILPDRSFPRPSLKQRHEELRRGLENPKFQGGELRGTISYPASASLGLVLHDDHFGTIVDKVTNLAPLDVNDVYLISASSEVDIPAFQKICQYEQLRDLELVVKPDIDGGAGSKALERLKELRYLSLACVDSCVFGSKRFCEAICSLSHLKYLTIPCEKLSDKDVSILATHPSLEIIYLRSRRPVLGRESLLCSSKTPRLKELFIVCTDDVRDADVVRIAEKPTLEALIVATNAP